MQLNDVTKKKSSSNKDPHGLWCGCGFFGVAVAGDTPILFAAPGADSSQITIPSLELYGTIQSNTPATAAAM